jgi:hypothetical protein
VSDRFEKPRDVGGGRCVQCLRHDEDVARLLANG